MADDERPVQSPGEGLQPAASTSGADHVRVLLTRSSRLLRRTAC